MKQRSPWLVILLILITGGLYSLYWLGMVSYEMRGNGSTWAPSPWWLVTFPLVIPVYLYLIWMHFAVREVRPTSEKPGDLIALLLFLFFIPGLIAYWQTCLNGSTARKPEPASSYCPNCGEPLDASAQYCSNCGSAV